MKKAILVLANGEIFLGELFGAECETIGEVVFNTSMTGYQEILTDPSYKGQIVVMTQPLIANYGITAEDNESIRPQVEGFVIKELSRIYSNWRAVKSVVEMLKEFNIVGIHGIDTRRLTKQIRDHGSQMGIISNIDFDKGSLLNKIKCAQDIRGRDMVKEVTCNKPYKCDAVNGRERVFNIAAMDFGIKRNIIHMLTRHGCNVTVYPAYTGADEIIKANPDGIFLSNGPGDPSALTYIYNNIKQFMGKKPIFGICLGHQLLGLALGAKIIKLKFGHHGGNHPVKNLLTKRIEITAQNHNYALSPDLPETLELTHINLYDHTVEGVRHKSLPIFSVQYHPEASPGPHDSVYLFSSFIAMMKDYYGK